MAVVAPEICLPVRFFMLNTPVLFLAFNRVEVSKKVFSAIRKAKPKKLFFAADGPRPGISGESDKCQEVRGLIDDVDWDCDVKTLFQETNLGCKIAVSSAIDWFFDNVEEGIVLEDDCVPSHSFFQFCQELLERYRHDNRIMQICGSNFLNGKVPIDSSYYFSQYGSVWGWASWRRAWNYYDVDLSSWPEVKSARLCDFFSMNSVEATRRFAIYEDLYEGKIDTWDYQWGLAKMINSGLSIIPNENLISNIGFGIGATHTTSQDHPYANLKFEDMNFPLIPPPFIFRNFDADRSFVEDYMHCKPVTAPTTVNYLTKIRRLLDKILGG